MQMERREVKENKRRYVRRKGLNLEDLRTDPNSLLSWDVSDKTLEKLETYRLYKGGYAVSDIAEAFGVSRESLYQMWKGLKEEGTVSLVDKRWGSAPRKRTEEKERAVLRAKALEPNVGDSELGRRYGMDRSTVYRLLKEHGLQDLHQVLCGEGESEVEKEGKKKKE